MRDVRIPFLLLLLLPAFKLSAQEDAEFRMEIGGALGSSFYLGDLNSKLFHQNSVAGGFVWRYLIDPHSAVKATLTYGGIKGKADVSAAYLPQNPSSGTVSTSPLQYSFSSGVIDLGGMYELNFWPYGYYQDYLGYKRLTPFIQLGLGFTYGTNKHDVSLNIPVGVGMKYRLGKRWNVGLDWTYHFGLSDKLDGLDAPLGIKSEGFKNKDSYSLLMITLTYNISPICPNCNKD